MPMKVMVLGGYGLTGQCAVGDLVENSDASEIVIAGRDLKKAQRLADRFKSKRISVELVDATKYGDLVKSIKDADVVINAVQYHHNLTIMKACLKAKVNYVDLGGLFHTTKKQLELDSDFKKARLTAVVGMGAQPGITNVMARYGAERLDSVETIHIRDGWKDLTEAAPPFLVTWSFLTLMDELTLPAIVFENGKFKEVQPLSRKETITFSEPVGIQDVYVTLHSEVLTLPSSFKNKGVRNVDWMEGGPGFIRNQLLVDMGLASNKPINLKGIEIVPREFVLALLQASGLLGFPDDVTPNDWETSKVEVIGKKDGRKTTYVLDVIFPPKKEWRVSCSQYAVGVPASIVAQMIGRNEIRQKGVIPPEICVEPEPFFKELGKRSIQVHLTLKKPLI
jgi:saccharopine dehydrogenase (NAD+, L-lysine-forming)